MKHLGFSLAFALLGSLPGLAGAAAPVAAIACPADPALATLVAASDLILVGRMAVPGQELAAEPRRYVDIPTTVVSTIKGHASGAATVRFRSEDTPHRPTNADVLALADAPAILFLKRVGDGPNGLYFAGYTPAALRPASAPNVAAARAEVARQAGLLRSWRPDPRLPHSREVARLIARLGRVEGDEQQAVFNRLEALGPAAVPAIVARMDDRRPLRMPQISLVNHAPDAWEAVRHYGPRQVVDGLDAVLNQITGRFGSIVNGGSDRERRAAVNGWRIYVADLHCRR